MKSLLLILALGAALASCGADCPLPEHASQVDVSSGASLHTGPPIAPAHPPLATGPLDYTRAVRGAETIEAAVEAVTTVLGEQGFGIVSELDFQAVMMEKADVELRPFRILGACNPALAHRIVSADPTFGLLLPCKVVVFQGADETYYASFARPSTMLSLTGPEGPAEVVEEVDAKIKAAFDAL